MEIEFKKIYLLPNHRVRENTNMDNFVFVGKNWDYYFSVKNKDKELETIENVVLTDKYDDDKFIDLERGNKEWKYLLNK